MAEMLLTIEHNGTVFSPPIKDEVKIEWQRTGAPGKLTFTTVKSTNMSFLEGDKVCFYYNDKQIFLGYVFTKKRDKKHQIEVTCYDQLRYLKNEFTYVFEKKTATQIITAMCKDYNLSMGTMDDTKYAIPALVEEKKSALDISLSTLEDTLMNTGKMYVLYDDCGKLVLSNAENMTSETLIMEETAENFDYSSSIDDETYNSIVLYYKPQPEPTSSSSGGVGGSGGSGGGSSGGTSAGASKILSVARTEIGVKEQGTNKVKYNTAYYGRAVSGSAYPWCCVFVWWVFKQAGLSNLFYGGGKTAACRTLMAWFKKKGAFYTTNPKPGDVVFFGAKSNGVATHVGIVESVKSSSNIVSIEGNCSNAVKRMNRTSAILGYGRPAYGSKARMATDDGLGDYGGSGGSSSSGSSSSSSSKIQVFSASDSAKIKEWGTLRYFKEIQTPNGGDAKAKQLLKLYNRKSRELKITGAFGDPTVRGGTLIPVKLNVGDLVINNYMLVDKVTHNFKNDHHTMDLTLEGAWKD